MPKRTPETLAEAQADRDDLRQKLSDVVGIMHDLHQEMTANIPLGGPDPAYDPNDEFKRCAVDRQQRVANARQKVMDRLAP